MYVVPVNVRDSEIEGCGTFAVDPLPVGTIVYLFGTDDIFSPLGELKAKKSELLRWGIQNEAGDWLVSKDCLNHSCDANLLAAYIDGIYFDIVVSDIRAGEEITADYALFYSSFEHIDKCACGELLCRGWIASGVDADAVTLLRWHRKLRRAIERIHAVPQPLYQVDDENARKLHDALLGKPNPRLFQYVKFSIISKHLEEKRQ